MKRDRGLRLIFYITVLLYALTFFLLLSRFVGNNPLNQLNKGRNQYISIFPEGWAFFTKSVVSPSLILYKVERHKLVNVDLRGFQYKYAFGLSRKNRLIQIELANAIKKVRNNENEVYTYNEESLVRKSNNLEINPDTLKFNPVNKEGNIILLQGKYIAVYYEFLPWSLLSRSNIVNLKRTETLIPFEIINK